MKTDPPKMEFLVLCRGQWDADKPLAEIQRAIEAFYVWHEAAVADGTMKRGQRLARAGRVVGRQKVVDGPFAEVKELIGGYWFIVASSLDEAAAIAAGNPCLACGLELEVRPVDDERASAYVPSCETPVRPAAHDAG